MRTRAPCSSCLRAMARSACSPLDRLPRWSSAKRRSSRSRRPLRSAGGHSRSSRRTRPAPLFRRREASCFSPPAGSPRATASSSRGSSLSFARRAGHLVLSSGGSPLRGTNAPRDRDAGRTRGRGAHPFSRPRGSPDPLRRDAPGRRHASFRARSNPLVSSPRKRFCSRKPRSSR